jgi:transaldolase
MPDKTLAAFFDHGEVGEVMPRDGGDCDAVLAEFTAAGVDLGAMAERLQEDGAEAFATSWKGLLGRLDRQAKS